MPADQPVEIAVLLSVHLNSIEGTTILAVDTLIAFQCILKGQPTQGI